MGSASALVGVASRGTSIVSSSSSSLRVEKVVVLDLLVRRGAALESGPSGLAARGGESTGSVGRSDEARAADVRGLGSGHGGGGVARGALGCGAGARRGGAGAESGAILEADLERRRASSASPARGRHRLLHADERPAGEDHRLALLLLDLAGEALLDVAAAGVDLLDLLEDRDGLGGEAVAGVLVGEGQQERHRLRLLVGQDQHVGELHAQARVGAPLLELCLSTSIARAYFFAAMRATTSSSFDFPKLMAKRASALRED